MRQAAKLWVLARQKVQLTAGDETIDSGMILIAQAMAIESSEVIIATTNVRHLSRFIATDLWQNVK
ncbi:MAG: hypothetical protein AAFN93_24835, partial [Bacteroidota bacterium]